MDDGSRIGSTARFGLRGRGHAGVRSIAALGFSAPGLQDDAGADVAAAVLEFGGVAALPLAGREVGRVLAFRQAQHGVEDVVAGVDAASLAREDQALEDRGGAAAVLVADEGPVLAADREWADAALGLVVRELKAAVRHVA